MNCTCGRTYVHTHSSRLQRLLLPVSHSFVGKITSRTEVENIVISIASPLNIQTCSISALAIHYMHGVCDRACV